MNNNNNSSIKNYNKIKTNVIARKLYPFFNSLPHNAPAEWILPFLLIVEDFQLFQYAISKTHYTKLSVWVSHLLTIFNPDIPNAGYIYLMFGLLVILTSYVSFIICYHIKMDGKKVMSKQNLMIYNSIYLIIFRCFGSLIFNFYTKFFFICQSTDEIPGIFACTSTINYIFDMIAIVDIIIIALFNFLYSNFYLDVNCLSSGKYSGSLHKANSNLLLFAKFFLAFQHNTLPGLLIYLESSKQTKLATNICLVVVSLLFLYISYLQLINQPYYSSVINNYKFGIYFSIALFSLCTVLLRFLKINTSKVIAIAAPVIPIILFIVGYLFNSFYVKKVLNRIYKKFHEKEMVKGLKSEIEDDELKYNEEKPKKKSVYKSVERITKEKFIRREIKVFKNFYECEMACRYLRNNRTIEAFHLMKKLYEEGMKQFKHESNIYIMSWYYIHSMKIFYKENDLLNKYDREIFNCEALLDNAMELKLNLRENFLIDKALNYIEMEKRENFNNKSEEISTTVKLEDLKNAVVFNHIQGLKEIKNLFARLKSSTNAKDVIQYSSNISRICKIQNTAESQYKSIIRSYPDAKDVIKIYMLFLCDVMDKEEVALRYSNMVGDMKMNDKNFLKGSANEIEPKSPNSNDAEEKLKNRRSINASSNSLASIPHSEDYSTASGMGRDLKKKLSSKNAMTLKYISSIKGHKLKMNLLIILFVIIFALQAIWVIVMFQYAETKTTDISVTIHLLGTVKEVAGYARMLSLSLITDSPAEYGKYNGMLGGYLYVVDDMSIETINNNMYDIDVDTPLIVPVGKYGYDTFEIKTIPEAYKKLIGHMRYLYNRVPFTPNVTVEDILYEPHFKYFIVNSRTNFDDALIKSKNVVSDDILSKFKILDYSIVVVGIVLFSIALSILYLTYGPLKRSTEKTTRDLFRMFKYISKDNFEEVITNYDEKIDTLCESFEIDKEIIENNIKNEKDKTYNGIKLTISFIIIIFFIFIVGIIVLFSSMEVRDILTLADKSADRYSLVKGIQLFTYEVIFQDRSIFVEDEPNRILNDLVNRLERVQEELKTGSYGGPTFDNYPALDYVMKEKGCHRMYYDLSCLTMVYDSSYGYSEEVGTLPMNELIREYLFHVNSFIDDVNDGKYILLPFSTKENIKVLFDQVLKDNFFKLQEQLVNNIIGDILVADDDLISSSVNILEQNKSLTIYMVIIGSVLLLIIDVFIFNSIYNSKLKEMITLVSFIFLMPQSIVNRNEKFKRFLETTQIDE